MAIQSRNHQSSNSLSSPIPFILTARSLRASTMATVDLNHVQFWQPPPKPSLYKPHTFPRKQSWTASATRSQNQPAAATRQLERGFEDQPRDEEVEAQGTVPERLSKRPCLICCENSQAVITNPYLVRVMHYHRSKRSWVHLCGRRPR